MKLSRRKMLGTLATGLATAKQAGEEIAKQVVNIGGSITMGATNAPMAKEMIHTAMQQAIQNKELQHAMQVKENITRLENFLKGELDEYQQKRMNRQYDATFEDIRSLKSISKATKERMWLEHRKKKEYQGWVKSAIKRLFLLKDEKKDYSERYYGDSSNEIECGQEEGPSGGGNFR